VNSAIIEVTPEGKASVLLSGDEETRQTERASVTRREHQLGHYDEQ
jgi:hypothetical protein